MHVRQGIIKHDELVDRDEGGEGGRGETRRARIPGAGELLSGNPSASFLARGET